MFDTITHRCTACFDMFTSEDAALSHEVGEFLEGAELDEWLAEDHEVEMYDDEPDHDFAYDLANDR